MHAEVFSFLFVVYGITSVFSKCINKNVTESTPFTLPSGDVMIIERFTCDNHPALGKPEPSNALERRQSSACSQSNCVCGVPCTIHNIIFITVIL
ncbi:hypothetical protein CPB84DRAFT_1782950 [Gymnopilus junonius]|uniref:Secreted protein n=1 Tax=Gymnopilus junonius TaxID=109634 RepID=A0A9P5NLN9_GYMJU|nr:hypothetical protein CPB84DRAFT_1782950 [Gymnopilus junonius]